MMSIHIHLHKTKDAAAELTQAKSLLNQARKLLEKVAFGSKNGYEQADAEKAFEAGKLVHKAEGIL